MSKKLKKAKNGFPSIGLTDKGFNYNSAWGGAWQNGGNMIYYQNGLDFEPKSMQNGGGITEEILLRQAYKESGLNPKAQSKAGAIGIAQIKKDALADYIKANKLKPNSIDLNDPKQAIKVQKWYMNNLYNSSFINKPDQDENVRLAKTLAAYNWGRGNLVNHLNALKSKGKDIYKSLDWMEGMPDETKDYINKIILKKDSTWEKEYSEAIKTNPNVKHYKKKAQQGIKVNPADKEQLISPSLKDIPEEMHNIHHVAPGYMNFKTKEEYNKYHIGEAIKRLSEEDRFAYLRMVEDKNPMASSLLAIKAPYATWEDYSKNKGKGKIEPHGNVLGRAYGLKHGGAIEDNMGQWKHPGKVTKINSNKITMKGVDYPVLGVSNTGDTKLMSPNEEYTYDGDSVTEYPLAESGIHIKESKKGTFTAAAKKHGKSVQGFASQVLANKENYSPAMVKKANFAKNAAKWKKGQDGLIATDNEPFSNPEETLLRSALLEKMRKQKDPKVAKSIFGQDLMKKAVKSKYSAIDPSSISYKDINHRTADVENYPEEYKLELLEEYAKQKGYSMDHIKNLIKKKNGGEIKSLYQLIGFDNPKNAQFGEQINPSVGLANVQPMQTNWGSENLFVPNQFSAQGQIEQFANTLPQTESSGVNDFMEKLGGPLNVINAGVNVAQGVGMLKQQKEQKLQAKRDMKLSKLTKQVSELEPEKIKRKYVRPEDQLTDPNTIAPAYGTGTTFLKHGGEIQNTYDPNTLYTHLGYEPLEDSVKQYQFGGMMPNLGGMVGSFIGGGKGQVGGASMIGQTLGGFAGPVGGLVGGAVGGFIDALGMKKTEEYQKKTQKNLETAALNQGVQGLKNQYTGFMEHGGNLTNPQVITKFGEYNLKDLLKPDPMMNTLRTGGNIRQNEMFESDQLQMGGQLKTYWGGKAEPMSENPHLPGSGETIMFKGASHDNGGIGVKFGKQAVEVEGGEPAVKLKDGGTGQDNLVVFGNMTIPSYGVSELGDENAKGKKFKHYIKDLSEKEARQNKIQEKGLSLINDTDVKSPFDMLKISSGEAMLQGTNMKLKDIAEKKKTASMIQNAILETADEFGLKSDELAKGKIKKAKYGSKLISAQNGWESVFKDKRLNESQKEQFLKENPEWVETEDMRLMRTREIPGQTSYASNNDPEFDKWFAAEYKKNPGGVSNYKGRPIKMVLGDKSKKAFTSPSKQVEDYIELYNESPIDTTPLYGKVDTDAYMSNLLKPSENQVTGEYQPKKKGDKFDWMGALNSVLPLVRPHNRLDRPDLSAEMYALNTNQLDPVQAQLYEPLLEQPYNISLQDQLNANQADFNAAQRVVGNNPEALAQLAAQKYAANSAILGEQMRINQGQQAGVFARNRATLNDATLKNLAILDQQFQRHSQAKSNTKAVAQAALSSIADKIAKNKVEDRTLSIYENLYNYRFLPGGQAINLNPLMNIQQMIENAIPQELDENGNIVSTETREKFDGRGVRTGKEVRTKTKNAKNGSIVKAMKNL